jgi:hypothetical protein
VSGRNLGRTLHPTLSPWALVRPSPAPVRQ